MLVKNQQVETVWNPTTRKHYEDLGYTFTKYKDKLLVKAEDLTPSSKVVVDVQCDRCGKISKQEYGVYNRTVKNRGGSYVCLQCAAELRTERERKEIAKEQIASFNKFCNDNGFTPVSVEDDYVNAHGKLYYICPKHGIQYTTSTQVRGGIAGCNECGNEKIGLINSFLPEKVKDIVESKNGDKLLNPEEYINNSTKNLRVICGSCGEEFTTCLASITTGSGCCSKCAKKLIGKENRLSSKEVEERINSVNGNKLLNPEDYVSRNCNNLKIRCGECGKVYTTSLGNYENHPQIRCNSCSQKISTLERVVMNFLDFNNIKYSYNHIFKDCKDKTYLPFDFYLPDYNLIIETDGEHHYRPVWSKEHFIKTILHDGMKNNYCRWNNIDLLRIPYWEGDNIEKILAKKLNADIPPHFKRVKYKPKKRK